MNGVHDSDESESEEDVYVSRRRTRRRINLVESANVVKRLRRSTRLRDNKPSSPSTHVICGMALSFWKNLIFSHLNLDELIYVKRTCTAFARYNDLRYMIRIRIKDVFGNVPKKYWNRACAKNTYVNNSWMNLNNAIFMCNIINNFICNYTIVFSTYDRVMKYVLDWIDRRNTMKIWPSSTRSVCYNANTRIEYADYGITVYDTSYDGPPPTHINVVGIFLGDIAWAQMVTSEARARASD